MSDEEDLCLTECPACDDEREHQILRQREVGKGTDVKVRCIECNKVHDVHLRPPRSMEVSFLLSDGATSEKTDIELDEDELLRIDDIFEHGDRLWKINSLESTHHKKMRKALPERIARVTAVRWDEVRVKVTMTDGEVSTPDMLLCEPERVFHTGAIMTHRGRKWRVRAVNTSQGSSLRGSYEASEIKRLYLQPPPEPPRAPEGGRERRQAWKEGRLGHNPSPQPRFADERRKQR